MKKAAFIAMFLLLAGYGASSGQEMIQEEVTVTAVEIPVRVFIKDRVLPGLNREDFELYENGIKQEITGFEAVSRRISGSSESKEGRSPKRVFILIFNIFDYNQAVGEGIDSFFKNHFREGDSFVAIVENQVLNVETGRGLDKVVQDLKDTLKRFKMISTMATLKNFRDLNYEADRLLAALNSQGMSISSIPQAMMRFFENYRYIWEDYRKQFLIPDVGRLEPILRRVKMIEGEKWAICFQQREMFPRLKKDGPLELAISAWIGSQVNPEEQTYARMVQARQSEMYRTFDVLEFFPTQSLKDLFMASNISFHLILLKSLRYIPSEDFELREVTQDYESTLRSISASTGGATLFSNDIAESIKEVTEREDIYYLLVYSPKGPQDQGKRKVEVKVRRPDARVVYLSQIPEPKAVPISIVNFQSGRQSISFKIAHFQKQEFEGKPTGVFDVRIRLFDERSKLAFDERNTLSSVKNDVKISLNLQKLERGKYFLILEVTDKVSSEADVYSGEIEL